MSDSMKILEQVLRQASIRHQVLASNVANVDTPGYRAKDVTFESVLGNEAQLATTSAGHIASGGTEGGIDAQGTVSDSRPWADGNSVELDLEVSKMTENAMLYEAGVSLLRTKMQMLKTALRTR